VVLNSDKSVIRLGEDVEVNAGGGHPVSIEGLHSGKTLAGIDLDMTAPDNSSVEAIEALLKLDSCPVYDPFAGRSYKATLTQRSMSYVDGHPERSYSIEIREIDEIPTVQELDIEGKVFQVLRYSENVARENAVGRHAVLRLSKHEFQQLRGMIKPGPVNIKRIGVDEEHLSLRFGGVTPWSEHEEDGVAYFKQLLRLYPADFPPSGIDLARESQLSTVAIMTVALTGRFELLLDELVKRQAIAEETRSAILGRDWSDLLSKDRLEEIIAKLDKVADAEEEL
jgi:hypothetical protein